METKLDQGQEHFRQGATRSDKMESRFKKIKLRLEILSPLCRRVGDKTEMT
jgi:hypothetical protein